MNKNNIFNIWCNIIFICFLLYSCEMYVWCNIIHPLSLHIFRTYVTRLCLLTILSHIHISATLLYCLFIVCYCLLCKDHNSRRFTQYLDLLSSPPKPRHYHDQRVSRPRQRQKNLCVLLRTDMTGTDWSQSYLAKQLTPSTIVQRMGNMYSCVQK